MAYDFTYLCFGNNNCKVANTIYIKRFNNGIIGTIIKIRRKIRIKLKKDFYEVGFHIFYNEFKKAIKSEKYDIVLSTPGIYSLIAYKYAIKNKIRFGLVYTDPFSENPFFSDYKKARRKIEYKWLKESFIALYDYDGEIPPFDEFDSKKVPFKFPIPKPVDSLPFQEDYFVYGVNFYRKYRSHDCLLAFANKEKIREINFLVYSNEEPRIINNVRFLNMVSEEQYNKIALSARAVIVIGNQTKARYIPSKYLLDIALRRPIISIGLVNKLEVLEKYPFHFQSTDPNLLEKLSAVKTKDLLSFDIYKIFPDRTPASISLLIYNEIEKRLV